MAADSGLDPAAPGCLRLLSAFFAMEPADSVISLAGECSGGSITENVQRFFWEHCIKAVGNSNAPYVKNFLKKLINKVDSENGQLLDEICELYALYMSSLKDEMTVKESAKVCKVVSFLFPESSSELPSCPKSRKLVIPLECSPNMLEGDTGCSVWPSSLFLSEFVLSFPYIFTGKSCFEVGSGVGLVGICLTHAKASRVILSDGDLLTLANMKLNLEMNQLDFETDLPGQSFESKSSVRCIHLPWESASEEQLQDFNPDIILGADVIYDPSCLPHLVRVLASFLNKQKSNSVGQKQHYTDSTAKGKFTESEASNLQSHDLPVAYIASVIRNIETFNCFLALAEKADLAITYLTGKFKPLDLLPYMRSYERSSVILLAISSR